MTQLGPGPHSLHPTLSAPRAQSGRYWKVLGIGLVAALVGLGGLGAAALLLLRNTPVEVLASPAPAVTTYPAHTPEATMPAPTTTAPAIQQAPAPSEAPVASLPPQTLPPQTQPPTTQPPVQPPPTTRPATTRAAQPGSQWPAYTYGGPNDLCRTPTFPEASLIKVGSGYMTATHSAEAALVALGYDGVRVDGVFDSSSAAALTRFQSKHGLIADGTLGQQSWTQLRSSLLQYSKC